ncbi:MAG: Na+/H+ antiporter subunit E, partial [Gammaproteobacteria bacterium]|nr:Na+/H+ antiporter subunit E [Gammaproteobacteria bacterium]
CIFWISLSGYFEPLMLGLGLGSVALTIFLAKRMNLIDDESYPFHLFSQLPAFFVYILNEIVKANIDVVKRIMTSKGQSISPQLIKIPLPQESDLGRVIYANSITLTPGTVSITLSKDTLTVHALTKEAAQDLAEGSMAKKIPDSVMNK